MSLLRPKTLKWLLVGRLAAAQGIALALLLVLVAVSTLWITGELSTGYSRSLTNALANAIDRDANGHLIVRETPAMAEITGAVRDSWFVVVDGADQRITRGVLPPEVQRLLPMIDEIDDASIGRRAGNDVRPIGAIQRAYTRAGWVHIVADVRGLFSLSTIVEVMASTFGKMLFVIGIMALATLTVTPFVVRRALKGLSHVADQAAQINIKRSGVRLPLTGVPAEVTPLVGAMNDALERLDRGYERHKRFLSDAAHELRTPIAILNTRISGLPKGPDRTRLLEDTARLTGLTGLLLDLQRLEQPTHVFTTLNVVDVVQRVLLDLSPLAFAAGYDVTFDTEADSIRIEGDEGAIERAVTNLIQNAIDHGGRHGEIAVWIALNGTISVCDDGGGIPLDHRESVFEPFRRLAPTGSGTGLGLDLVQKTMKFHGGYAEVFQGEKCGACFRLVFHAG